MLVLAEVVAIGKVNSVTMDPTYIRQLVVHQTLVPAYVQG